MSTQVPEVRPPAPGGGGRTRPEGVAARFDSWYGIVWTIVVAVDFFWLANPRVLATFDHALWIVCIATAVGAVVTVSRFRGPRPAETVLAFLVVGFASVLWSIDPAQTFSFTAKYAAIAAVATVVARNADARAVVHGVVLGGLATLGASAVAVALQVPAAMGPLYPSGGGDFAGVGGNRNILSYTLVLAFAFGASLVPRTRRARLLWALAIAALLVGIGLSLSVTGLIATPVIGLAALALLVSDRHRLLGLQDTRRSRLLWAGGAVGVIGIVVGAGVVVRLLGRSVTSLSGRTDLWAATWSTTTGADRWFGSGWGAVWRRQWAPADDNSRLHDITEHAGLVQWHGHSSFFDMLPELGLIGIAVYAMIYVQTAVRAVRLRSARGPGSGPSLQASRTTILALLALLVMGLTEPMSTIPLAWFAIVLAATGLVPTTPDGTGRRARRY